MKTTRTEMTVNVQPLSMDVIIVHPAGSALAAAHEAARSVPGVRIVDTFRDGWGRVVTMAIASNVN